MAKIEWLSQDEALLLHDSAEALALKFELGIGPRIGEFRDALVSTDWCGCGIGHVCRGAGLDPMRRIRIGGRWPLLAAELDLLTGGDVSDATYRADIHEDTSDMAPALRKLAAALVDAAGEAAK